MIKLKDLLKEEYTAVVLDDKSRQQLVDILQDKIPDGWEVVAHHMTIDPFSGNSDERIGASVDLNAIEVGISDMAMAVKVSGYDRTTNNAFPHVTIAVNRESGGKAKDSNTIQQWDKLEKPISISGVIQNVL